MSAICPNCGAHLGCSCQLRTSLSGIRCCSNCVAKLNSEYMEKKRKGDNPYNNEKKPVNMNRRNVII